MTLKIPCVAGTLNVSQINDYHKRGLLKFAERVAHPTEHHRFERFIHNMKEGIPTPPVYLYRCTNMLTGEQTFHVLQGAGQVHAAVATWPNVLLEMYEHELAQRIWKAEVPIYYIDASSLSTAVQVVRHILASMATAVVAANPNSLTELKRIAGEQ